MNYYRSLDKNKFQFDFVCDENSTIPYENEIKNWVVKYTDCHHVCIYLDIQKEMMYLIKK